MERLNAVFKLILLSAFIFVFSFYRCNAKSFGVKPISVSIGSDLKDISLNISNVSVGIDPTFKATLDINKRWTQKLRLMLSALIEASDYYKENKASAIAIIETSIASDSSVTDTIACGSFVWNGTNYTSSGSYSKTFPGGGVNGTDSVAILNLTINPIPAKPTISFTGNLSFCTGDSVVLRSSAGIGYQWYKGGSLISGTSDSVYNAKTSGNYTVKVTNVKGCISAASYSVTVAVSTIIPASPTIQLTGNTVICPESSLLLTANAVPNNQYYQWYNGTTAIIGADRNLCYATTAGNYTVIATYNKGCSSAPSAPLTITEAPFPAISVKGNTTICAGDSVLLNASPGTSYQWYTGGNALLFNGLYQDISVFNNANIPIGNTNYTLEAWIKPTDSGSNSSGILGWGSWGQQDQTNAFRLYTSTGLVNYWFFDDLIVPTPNLADGSWHHVAASFDGTARSIYVDGLLMGSNIPTGTHNVPDASNMYIGVTNDNGNEYFKGAMAEVRVWNVARTQVQIQASMNIPVNPNSPGLVAYYPFAEGAGNSTADITANGNNGTLEGSPTWVPLTNFPIQGYSVNAVPNNTTSSISVKNSGNYYVMVTDSNGCVNSTPAVTITVNPALTTPTITAGGPTSFCPGGAVLLNASAAGNYQWNKNDTAITGATASTYNATTAGNFTVTITNASNCSATSSAITVTVNPLITPTVSATRPLTFCTGDSTTLLSSGATGNQWYLDGIAINAATANNYSTTKGGIFTVSVTNLQGCTSFSNPVTVVENSTLGTGLNTHDTLICKADSINIIALANSQANYSWTSASTGFVSNSAAIAISQPDLYRVKIVLINSGCIVNDSIQLTNTSDTAIKARLAVSEQAFVNQEIELINLTSPAPQTENWIIPTSATVMNQTDTSVLLTFPNTGEYMVYLTNTSYKVCSSTDSAKIIISQNDSALLSTGNKVIIEQISIGPNPSPTGLFNCTIKLNVPGKVAITIFNLSGTQVYRKVIPAGNLSSIYQRVDLSSSPVNASYVVVFQTDYGYEVRTIIIN